jgi:hypothetical protein
MLIPWIPYGIPDGFHGCQVDSMDSRWIPYGNEDEWRLWRGIVFTGPVYRTENIHRTELD